jgi:chromatin remodeling complex protein RSC6
MTTEHKQIKLEQKIKVIRDQLEEQLIENKKQKQQLRRLLDEIKTVETMVDNMKIPPKEPSTEKPKPRGFSKPGLISNDLCYFLKIPFGSYKSRTEVTKYLIHYISENNLQNTEHKKIILPDESLQKILGEESIGKEITYFTLQKYMNKHYLG